MNEQKLRKLLCCLSDGQIHSGESLGLQLGVGRAAVWKQVQQAQARGLPLLAHKGSGYQLPMALEWLDAVAIRHALQPPVCSRLSEIVVLFEVDSTNNYVLKQLREGRGAPFAVLAERQTAGRGRRGRRWFSPFASSIYLTLGWHYSQGLAALEGLSLVTGLKLLQALQKLGVGDLALKWPNDVMWRQQKLAGVLIEIQGDPAGECQVAIGIGLNVHVPAALRAEAVDQPWVDLQQVLQSPARPLPSRNELVAVLLNELVPALEHLEQRGFAAHRDDWQRYDYCWDQWLAVQSGTHCIEGRGAGVNASGAYQVDTAEGRHQISGGEISLRVQHPET